MSTFTTLRTRETSRDTDCSSGSHTSSKRPDKTKYRLIEDVEDLDRYCPGGYHPLHIADELDGGRYRLVDKLGYVAVKVITANTSLCTHEPGILYSLKSSPSRLGREIIQPLIGEFWVAGPNEKYRCIVTPPARMSLFDAKEASTFGLFQPRVAQSIIAQLIRGVAFLHRENIVHGDLYLGNILVQFPETIDCVSTLELYERYGEPEPEPVVRHDGKPLPSGVPPHLFIPCWFGVRIDEIILGEEKIILSDFRESFNPHKVLRFSSKTLPLLQPPEARFPDEPLSFASDIWTLACSIWEIFGQRPLFEAFFATKDRVIKEQVEVLGILPPEWWAKWSRRLEWFTDEGELILKPEMPSGHDGVRRTWDKRFDYCIQEPRAEAGLETVTEGERRAFEAMLRSMLIFRPNERATAQQALNSEWMNDWGPLALEMS